MPGILFGSFDTASAMEHICPTDALSPKRTDLASSHRVSSLTLRAQVVGLETLYVSTISFFSLPLKVVEKGNVAFSFLDGPR